MPAHTAVIAENVTYSDAFTILENNNLTEMEINTLIWGVLGESLGKTKRVFNYGATFSGSAPACTASFSRSFVHTDWIDGESIVQAEQNSIEEGFNTRFHRIEDDLDALSTDVNKAFGCIADMRGELAARLTELRTEINRINDDIFECCKKDEDPGGVVYPGPFYPYPIDPGFGHGPVGPAGPIVTGPGTIIPTGPLGPLINESPWTISGPVRYDAPWSNPGSLAERLGSIGSATFPGPSVTRSTSDPTRATVAGMPARRLDVSNLAGTQYEVWSTNSGIVLTPAEAGIDVGTQTERSWTSTRTDIVGDMAEWTDNRMKDLTRMLGNGATVGEISKAFGDDRLAGGATLRDTLAVLPSSTNIAKPDELLNMVADRAAVAVARDGLATEMVVANIGLSSNAPSVAKVPMSSYKAIPTKARQFLEQQGVKTIGEFNQLGPQRVAAMLNNSGLGISQGQVARWSGEALVLDKVAAKGGL